VAWILDLDGVVWLSERPIPGSPEAVAALREAGHRVMFLTNNAGPRVADLVEKLEGMGIPAQSDEVVTSAQAAASMLEPGGTALLCAGPGVREALEARGIEVVLDGDADAVVVGFHRDFDYERLTAAFLAVHHGARLVGTNDDTTYPTPDGPIPGGGAILAAVAAAAGVEPEVAGKPYAPMADLLAARLAGPNLGGDAEGSILVGDRPSTDGLMARRLGLPFALVLSGVTAEEEVSADDRPDHVVADLATLVRQELGLDPDEAAPQESAPQESAPQESA
jgi:4-nitrophenyl phosphatase